MFLKVMEHMARAKHLTVGKKVKKRKIKKGQSKKSVKTGQVRIFFTIHRTKEIIMCHRRC